jgi:ketosteroid isomerase-like protein
MGKDEITAIEHQFIAATNSEEIMVFMDDDHVRYDYVAPLQSIGAAALRASFDQFFADCKNPKGRFITLNVVADEQMGVAHSLMHFTWSAASGAPAEAAFRVTHCFHKKQQQWKIFHTHVSFPMNPTTGMSETNLKA